MNVVDLLGTVILKPSFARRISRDVYDINALAKLLGQQPTLFWWKSPASCVGIESSREILRATAALQDDRFKEQSFINNSPAAI